MLRDPLFELTNAPFCLSMQIKDHKIQIAFPFLSMEYRETNQDLPTISGFKEAYGWLKDIPAGWSEITFEGNQEYLQLFSCHSRTELAKT